jgi:S-DNA-T family DNA segregation ATPase FtsK/SpoIIIE
VRLVIDIDHERHDVELTRAQEAATIADLIGHTTGVTLDDEALIWVDDRRHTAGDRLREVTLLDGSRIGTDPLGRPGPVTGWSATVLTGLDAGDVHRLAEGKALLVGRSRDADIVVDDLGASRKHATLTLQGDTVRVVDHGSANGTIVGDKVLMGTALEITGATAVTVAGLTVLVRPGLEETLAPAPGSLPNVTRAGTAPFNRPPQPGRLPDPGPVKPPSRKDASPPSKFSMVTVIAPLLMAAVTVAVMRNPAYALIALLSPVMAIGTWWEQRRRHRKDVGQEDERFAEALEEMKGEIAAASLVALAARRDAVPDPGTALRRAALPTTRLWQRRARSADVLLLNAGVGEGQWEPTLDTPPGYKAEDAVTELLGSTRLHQAPVEVDLSDAGVVGIVGDREAALALARSLVAQAVVHVGPADLTVGVFCDQGRVSAWSWTAWMPHLRRSGEGGGLWFSGQRQRSDTLLRGLRDTIDHHATPLVLLVLDSEVLLEGRDAPARSLLGHGRRPEGSHSSRAPLTSV